MTPWLLLGTLVGLPAALAFRRSRMSAIILIAAALPLAKYMSTAAKQLDRYGLVFYVPLVLVAAIGLGECVRRLAGRPRQAALVAMAGIAAAAVVVSTAQLPIGTAYYNPLFGGAKAAQHVVLLGNGEGVPQAVELIRRRVDDKCKGVTVSGAEVLASLHIRCTKPPKKGVPPRFSIITITKAQRTASKPAAVFAARRQLVGTVTIHGVVYATVWEDRRPSTLSRQPGAKQPSAKQASAG
jgi:hypothetical protein